MSTALVGRRVLVTRRWPELVAALSAAGATVAEVPAIETALPEDLGPLDEALRALERYDWIVFTSASAVEAVAGRMQALGLPLPVDARVASVGPATTHAIADAWPAARVDVQPGHQFRGAALLEAFVGRPVEGRRMLVPVSDRAADTVTRGLVAMGARVDRVVAYRTVASAAGERLRAEVQQGFDAVVFASPSAVEAFVEAAGEAGRRLPAVAIGPTTAEALRAAGIHLLATADAATAEGLVKALGRALRG